MRRGHYKGGHGYRDLQAVADETGLKLEDIEDVFSAMLKVGFRLGSITAPMFGRFEFGKTPPSRRRDPRNGRWIAVPERFRIGFVPSERLMRQINAELRVQDMTELNDLESEELSKTVRAWNPKVGVSNPRPKR
jgi:nucleoid DNA-binding protein